MKVNFLVANFRKVVPDQTVFNLLKFYLPFFLILLVSGLQNAVPVHILTRDVFADKNTPPYTGLISNLGVLVLCCSAAVCLFTFFLLQPTTGQAKKTKNCLGYFGLISAWMMIDDFFMLHDEVMPLYLGIPEKLVILLTLTWVFFHVVYFRTIILTSTNFKLLGLAFLFLGFSLFIDILPGEVDYVGNESNLFFLLEDGSKLMGIATWCFYLFSTCSQQILLSQRRYLSQH
ncbi:hypothetical protein VB834_29300 [Limnoraphis robusta Tam1]|uniref:hypothetical protein n=1 Tax=Limnoraphis robusta TaxID=1118279 RepID=UPI002B1EE21E|nr:hypothetical protein [Limnoraphis robusta]MEA5543132.1 hypothetical protein [Limnoraphis robusta Tam1]